MTRVGLRTKVFLTFLVLTAVTFVVALYVRSGLDALARQERLMNIVQDFRVQSERLQSYHPRDEDWHGPAENEGFEAALERTRVLAGDLRGAASALSAEVGRGLSGLQLDLDHYQDAYHELRARYAREQALLGALPGVLRAARAELPGDARLDSDAHRLLSGLVGQLLVASATPSAAAVGTMRRQAERGRELTLAPALQDAVDALARTTEELYVNRLALREREAFLKDTVARFARVTLRAVESLRDARARHRSRLDATLTALLGMALLLTLGFWGLASRYFGGFLAAQSGAIAAVRERRPELAPFPASDDELGDLVRVTRELAESVRESERWLRRAVEESPFPTMIFAADGEVLTLNRVWTTLSGYGRDQISSVRDWARHAYGDEGEAPREGGGSPLRPEQPGDAGVSRIRTASGEIRDWRFRTVPLGHLPDGRGVEISSAVDVTEENRLRRELEFAGALVRQTQEPVYCLDPADDYRLVYVNAAAVRHYGYPAERLLQMRIPDWDPVYSLDEAGPPGGVGAVALQVFETVHRLADGREVPVEIAASRVRIGDRELVVGTIHDLSQRRAAERALRDSETRYRAVFNQQFLLTAILAPDGTILEANDLAVRELGTPRDRLVGKKLWEGPMWLGTSPQAWPDRLADAARQEHPVLTEESFRGTGGAGRLAQIATQAIRGPTGAVELFLLEARDVTDQRRVEADRDRLLRDLRRLNSELESKVEERTRALSAANLRLQELDRLKSLFIASMSHELRTPLNSIIGFSGLILMDAVGALNERQRDYLRRVEVAGQHLLRLINDVIDVSKIESGKLGVQPERFMLRALVAETVETLRPAAQALDVALSFEVPDVAMHTDRNRLRQCLTNFIENAIKYGGQSPVRVTGDHDRHTVTLRVRDEGPGIAPDDVPRLFRQFARLDSPLTRRTPGTGLGLYLTRKLAREVLGGDVGVESRPGAGSTFWISLPRTLPEAGDAAGAPVIGE